MKRPRPQVVAHRGSSATNAEHTLGAYIAALDEGAEGLECDVRLSADGHLICFHDRDLRRTGGSKVTVSTMDLADLEDYDVATWKNPWAELDDEAPDEDPSTRRVLTMRELLQTVADYPRRVELAIEDRDRRIGVGIFLRHHGLAEGSNRLGAPAAPGIRDASEACLVLKH